MIERPILFSGPMVKAIMAGTKTQTRRIIKPQPTYQTTAGQTMITHESLSGYFAEHVFAECLAELGKCARGKAGDLLWVKETYWIVERRGQGIGFPFLIYDDEWTDGDIPDSVPLRPSGPVNRFGKRPSIFMPRWASRITLEVVSVRVERVQEISDKDCEAEGLGEHCFDCTLGFGPKMHFHPDQQCQCADSSLRDEYARLWDSLNAKRDSGKYRWEANCWVWRIEFRKL